MDYEAIEIKNDGAVAWLTLNRPIISTRSAREWSRAGRLPASAADGDGDARGRDERCGRAFPPVSISRNEIAAAPDSALRPPTPSRASAA